MAWLEGLVKGFNDRRIEVATQNEERAKRQNELEQKVFSTLLGSEDEELRAMGFNELLRSAGGPKKKGGLRGWLGEYQDSGAMDRVRGLIDQPIQIAKPGLPSRALQPQFQIGTMPGLVGAPTTPAKEGSAATPSQSSVEGGPPPGPTPVGTAGTSLQPVPPATPPTGTVPESLAQPPEPPPAEPPGGVQGGRPVFPQAPLVPREREIPRLLGSTAPGVDRPAPSAGAFGGLAPGSPAIEHKRKVFLGPQEQQEREVQLEGQRETAKRRSEFEFLSGIYGPERAKEIFADRMVPGQERWAQGAVFEVEEPDGQGGVVTRHIQSVRGPDGKYYDALTRQPIPRNAQPVRTGGRTGQPTIHMMKGADGVDRPYVFDDNGQLVPLPGGLRAPGAAPENPRTAGAQEALKIIDDDAKRLFDAGASATQIDTRRRAMAQKMGYDSYDEVQIAAGHATRGAPIDDPALPEGVRSYIARLAGTVPLEQAQAELTRTWGTLTRDHPNLDLQRVRTYLVNLYAARGQVDPNKLNPPSVTPQQQTPQTLQKFQVQRLADYLHVTYEEAKAQVEARGIRVVE